MPRKGIKLPDKTVQIIKSHLKKHRLTQAKFAEQLAVSPKTLNNWLSGRNTIDQKDINKILEMLGVGLEDFFAGDIPKEYVFHEEIGSVIWRIYKSGLAILGCRVYKRIAELFKTHINFVIPPKKGFFQTVKQDSKSKKDYYFQFYIIPEEKVNTARFVISFTLADVVRIDYGEFTVKQDIIEVIQYYQPPNYQVKRPTGNINAIKVATWFDELPHTFTVVSDIRFKIEKKGEISEETLQSAEDIVIFWKHFFFHR